MMLDVDDARHVRELVGALREEVAAISFSTEFLAPPTVTVPASGPPGAR